MKKILPVFLCALALVAAVSKVRAEESSNDSPVRRVPLTVGMEAPDFTLASQMGDKVTLSKFHGKNVVVLYFYPKDGTPGCTKEAQDFRDDFERFKKAGAMVLGVSVDDLGSHKIFAKQQDLNFPILADVGGEVSRKYGVMGWIMAKRVTYVIGRDGKIKYVDDAVQEHLPNHTKTVLKVVHDLTHHKS